MDILSPVSDDEREDGEIVDDDLEDISDYSIPSCGKSDYSEGIIRAISLSSISGSDGERTNREYTERKVLLTTLRQSRRFNRDDSNSRSKKSSRKRHRDGVSTGVPSTQSRSRKHRRKSSYSRSASLSSSSSDSSLERHVMDSRTLRQLEKAVRIDTNSSDENNRHKTLKDRLQRMINPDAIDVGVDSFNLRSLVIDVDVDPVDAEKDEETHKKLDETLDKELEELRLQALKSAMIKKHMERKKRKEALMSSKAIEQNSELLQHFNDKENCGDVPNALDLETKTIEKLTEDDITADTNTITVEEDLDIMRAMLLASMSKKITTEQPSSTSLVQTSQIPRSLSNSSSPVPPEFITEKKNLKKISAVPVKPLIIRFNPDSESDTDFEYDFYSNNDQCKSLSQSSSNAIKIESSVDEFLRKQREQFEAKLAQNEANQTTETSESSLDKSFLKLLPKSQQQEYKRLREKLLQAKTTKTKTTKSSKTKTKVVVLKDPKELPKIISETLPAKIVIHNEEKPRKDKKDRLQPKGKYRELAPLVKKIQTELAAMRKQEEHTKQVMEQLKAARAQLAVHQQRHSGYVAQFKKARAIVDLRWENKAQQQKLLLASKKIKVVGVCDDKENKITPSKVDALETTKESLTTNKTEVMNNNTSSGVQTSAITPTIAILPSTTTPATTVDEQQAQKIEVEIKVEEIPTVVNESNVTDVFAVHTVSSVPIEDVTDVPDILSYVSPLDKRETKSNPLQMLCPYELFGVCKDAACTFNHCP